LIYFSFVRPDHELKISFNTGDYALLFFGVPDVGRCIELQDQWILEWDVHRTFLHISHKVRVQVSFDKWGRIQIVEDVVITADGNLNQKSLGCGIPLVNSFQKGDFVFYRGRHF